MDPLQKEKVSWTISIQFFQKHHLFLSAIINLPENFPPLQLIRPIKTQWSFLSYIHIFFTLQ